MWDGMAWHGVGLFAAGGRAAAAATAAAARPATLVQVGGKADARSAARRWTTTNCDNGCDDDEDDDDDGDGDGDINVARDEECERW